jgi:hypothetical protein
MQTKTLPTTNELTADEIARLQSMYYDCPRLGDKLILKQLQYMPDSDIYNLCDCYDSVPFVGSRPEHWSIKRDGCEIKVLNKVKEMGYIIDTHNGDVNILRNGMRSHLGTAGYAFQFHLQHYYAFPLKFGRGHWANGKTPFQLGIAVPNRTPLKRALMQLYDNDETLVNDYLNDKLFRDIDLYDVNIFDAELTEINKQLALKS